MCLTTLWWSLSFSGESEKLLLSKISILELFNKQRIPLSCTMNPLSSLSLKFSPMMTAQSALARLASTFKVKMNELNYFFAPTLNKQMSETSQEVEQPTGLDSIHTETEQKPQNVRQATFSWRRSGKAIWVPWSLDTPFCIFCLLTWQKKIWFFTVLLWVWEQLRAFRVFPFVIWCVSKSCYGFGHCEPHLFDTCHLFVGCLYVIHLPAAQSLCFLAI